MKADNICDVPGCGKPGRTVRVAVDTTDDAGRPIGCVKVMDSCEQHRNDSYANLAEYCHQAIEAAIKENAKKV